MKPMRTIRLVSSLSLLVAALAATDANALPITITDQQRSAAVEVSVSDSSDAAADSDADETLLSGPASLVGFASVFVPGASATGFAGHESEVGTALVGGNSGVSASTDAAGAGAFALASAESRFRITFIATGDVSLRLTGSLEANGFATGDSSALLELSAIDPVEDPLLLLFEVGPGEDLVIDAIAALHAGVAYRLVALARAGADSFDGETGAIYDASFEFALTEVPEPGTALTIALGLALLSNRQRRTPNPHRPA